MITLDMPIAVVCRMNQKGDIKPFKFRLKEAGGEARTCYVEQVDGLSYGRYHGDEIITYDCTTMLDGEAVACSLMYSIDSSSWLLHQMHSTIGIAI